MKRGVDDERSDDGDEKADDGDSEEERSMAEVRDAARIAVVLGRVGVVLDVERLGLREVRRGGIGDGEIGHRDSE